MSKSSNGRTPAARYQGSASLVAGWVKQNIDLIHGLCALRELGPGAESALRKTLALPDVNRFRLSWELFDALLEGDGLEPDELLLRYLPWEWVEDARLAFFGGDATECS